MVAVVVKQHGIRTADTRFDAIPGYASLIKAEWQVTDAVNNQILPVEIHQVLTDNADNFMQFVTGDSLKIHFICNGGNQVFAGNGKYGALWLLSLIHI